MIIDAKTIQTMKTTVPALHRVRNVYRTFFNVKKAWRTIRQLRAEFQSLAAMIETVRRYNLELAEQVRILREERDDLAALLGQYKVVDPNAKCPGCGAADGEIETKQSIETQRAYVQHTCKVCKCIWPEVPVYKDLATLWAKPDLPPRR